MKSLNPKDRPKLIALIAVALMIFAYSAFQMKSYDGAQAAMIAKAEAAKKAAGNSAGAASVASAGKPGVLVSAVTPGGAAAGIPGAPLVTGVAGAVAAPGAVVVPPDTTTLAGALASLGPAALLPPTGGKDPFIPTGHFAEEQVKAAAPPVPVTAALPTIKLAGLPSGGGATIKETLPGGIGPFPGLNPGSAGLAPGGIGGIGGAGAGPVVVETPPPPAFTLTGIIIRDASDSRSNGPGDTGTIAVLHGGNSTSPNARFVSVGDPVGNGYKVASVRSNAVDLKNGSHVVTLKMETEDK